MNTKNIVLSILCAITTFATHAMEQQHKYLTQGVLVAIEGIDGAGKTTLAQAVNNVLTQRGFNTVLTKEPGDTPLGQKIREIVLAETKDLSLHINNKAEFLLFAADRAQHFAQVIVPAYIQDKLIISDRLADSSLAYQGYGRLLDCDLKILRNINAWVMCKPDITIFINIPIEVALERCKKRAELSIFEHESLLKRIAYGFNEIYKNRDDVITIDGTKSPEELSDYVCKVIEQWIEEKQLIRL